MNFLDYLQNPALAYSPDSGQSQSNFQMPGVTSYAQPQQASQTMPNGMQSQPNVSSALPGQQNFDAIQKSIMAQQSPYVSFGANGWLQNNHPGIAHALDNAFLAAANTTTGRTAAENISGVARGVIGGRQEMLQHNVQQALLPVELAQRQFAYQKQYLDVNKDQAQIGEANANAQMNTWRAANYARLTNSSTSPYSTTRVGTDGQLWGIRKDNGKLEQVPGQDDNSQTGDPGGAPSFPVPGATGKTSMTDIYAKAAQGDPAAQATLRTYLNTQRNIAGAKTGAVNDANDPKNYLDSESKAALDQVGAAPKNSHDEYKSWAAQQFLAGTSPDKITSEADWANANSQKYNSSKSQAQQDVSEYKKSQAWKQGISMKDWKAIRARTAQTPGQAQQAPAAQVPGASQAPQGVDPKNPLGF